MFFLPNKYTHTTMAWFSFYLLHRHLQNNDHHTTSTEKIQFAEVLHGAGPASSWLNADTGFAIIIDFP